MGNTAIAVEEKNNQVLNEHFILEAMQESLGMIEFQTNGTISWVNDLFAKVTGYAPEELMGQSHRLLCPPKFVQSADYKHFWEQLRQGHSFQEKIMRVGKSGNTIWLEATYLPIKNAEGNVEGILKIATDITERENKTRSFMRELKEVPEQLSQIVSENAQRNMQAVEDLIKETQLIKEVTSLIHDISTQTNILALNAAIEAAHAGDAGRGFTRIAEEVRKLSDSVKVSIQKADENTRNILKEAGKVSVITDELQKETAANRDRFQLTLDTFAEMMKE